MQERDAVHVLHAEVCEDEVEAAAPDHLERLAPVRRGLHVVALLLEDGGGRQAHVLLVVHDEDAVPRGARAVVTWG